MMGEHSYAEPSVCAGRKVEDFLQLKDWLPNPLAFRYHVCRYEEVPSDVDHTSFHATVRVDINTEEQVKEWVSLVNASSGVTWRVDVTRPRLGRRVLFNASYRCQHRQRKTTSTRSKNTNCEAMMQIKVKSMSSDPQMPYLPMEARISNCHNHNLHVAEALRYRDVGEKAKEILISLFEVGHTPTSALAVFKQDLQMEDAEHYVQAAANREVCPDLKFVQGLFLKMGRAEYGCQSGPTMMAALQSQVEAYNLQCKDSCAVMASSSRGELLVAVCSPLMKRVHQTKQSVMDALPAAGTEETLQPVLMDDPEAPAGPSTERDSHQELLADPDAIPGPSAAGSSQELLQEPDGVSLAREITEVLTRCGQDPLFTPGLAAMARQLQQMQTNPSKLLSALHTFGKSGSDTSKRSVKLRIGSKRQGPQICVQPSAAPLRKQKCGSRSRVQAGRPGKQHDLTSAVADNISLAKKH